MSNNIYKFLLWAIGFFAIASCEKKDEKVIFEGGTAPVLTATSTANTITLNKDSLNYNVIKFNWTNPDYTFNTGIGSQGVNYYIQFDTAGANFSSSNMQQYSVTNDLEKSLTNGEINTMLMALGLDFGKPYNVEMRLKSFLGLSAVPLFSNVVSRTFIPYSSYPDLWITGDATSEGWTNAPSEAQKFGWDASNRKLIITMHFVPDKYYKFLTKNGTWQPQYGGTSATGGTLKANLGDGQDPDGIPTPATEGDYKLSVDLEALTLVVTPA